MSSLWLFLSGNPTLYNVTTGGYLSVSARAKECNTQQQKHVTHIHTQKKAARTHTYTGERRRGGQAELNSRRGLQVQSKHPVHALYSHLSHSPTLIDGSIAMSTNTHTHPIPCIAMCVCVASMMYMNGELSFSRLIVGDKVSVKVLFVCLFFWVEFFCLKIHKGCIDLIFIVVKSTYIYHIDTIKLDQYLLRSLNKEQYYIRMSREKKIFLYMKLKLYMFFN